MRVRSTPSLYYRYVKLELISLADFPPLSVTKINILFINNQGLKKDASVTKSMPF